MRGVSASTSVIKTDEPEAKSTVGYEQEVPQLRVLTDRGSKYCGKVEQHDYELYLAVNDVDHTRTKAQSPQTNGICERFHKTIPNEFCQVTFRKKIYATLEELQADLDAWIATYNDERTHQGKMCCGRTPMATFEDGKRICREKSIARHDLTDITGEPGNCRIGSRLLIVQSSSLPVRARGAGRCSRLQLACCQRRTNSRDGRMHDLSRLTGVCTSSNRDQAPSIVENIDIDDRDCLANAPHVCNPFDGRIDCRSQVVDAEVDGRNPAIHHHRNRVVTHGVDECRQWATVELAGPLQTLELRSLGHDHYDHLLLRVGQEHL
jgi:Integrase core domain